MNERIRELAEQAGSTHKQNLGVYQFFANELEKFAELIAADVIRKTERYGLGCDAVKQPKEDFGESND